MQKQSNGFVLHSRPYTDSRILVDWLTAEEGCIASVARAPSKKNRSCFQLFQKHLLVYQGRNDLKKLIRYESSIDRPLVLIGDSLKCGFYLNELIVRLVPRDDPESNVFSLYEKALLRLSLSAGSNHYNQIALRCFELDFISDLGYAINFETDAVSNLPIREGESYLYKPGLGFLPTSSESFTESRVFAGQNILEIKSKKFDSSEVLLDAKFICRTSLAPLLGSKPLKSRELFK